VEALAGRWVGNQFLAPFLVVLMEASLVVVDEYAGGRVHRIY
jgi:hypothetical protein